MVRLCNMADGLVFIFLTYMEAPVRSMRKRSKLKHSKGAGKRINMSARKDEMDDVVEYRVMAHGHDSQHWQVRLDEIDAFGPVTVRNGAGELVRIITVDALRRPWQEKVGNTWNNCLFPKRKSGKV